MWTQHNAALLERDGELLHAAAAALWTCLRPLQQTGAADAPPPTAGLERAPPFGICSSRTTATSRNRLSVPSR